MKARDAIHGFLSNPMAINISYMLSVVVPIFVDGATIVDLWPYKNVEFKFLKSIFEPSFSYNALLYWEFCIISGFCKLAKSHLFLGHGKKL